RYAQAWPEPHEQALAKRFSAFAASHDDCLQRSCLVGHITASCWIVAPDRQHVLLTHHRKLQRWLQLGGHVDGEAEIELAALREVQEESGMQQFEFVRWAGAALVPLDLDVHPIPARGAEPRHEHWDVRFLLQVPFAQPLVLSEESNELRWLPVDELTALTDEDSVLRLARKAAQLGAHPPLSAGSPPPAAGG
ncbi:MAG: NUDIX hydrolase, partial [Planctomycetes bacterium]|nr:NUDIX hydrolase [Planctomycetota bacterium]